MPRTRRYPRFVAVALTAILLGAARDAAAHARLGSASPAEGARLEKAPAEITLTFTEPIEPALSSVTLRDSAGNRFETIRGRGVRGDRHSCLAPLPSLKPGAYVVEWRAVSVDGHAVTGSYTFTIRAHEPEQTIAIVPPPASIPSPAPPPLRASRREMIARWLFIMGVASLLGAAAASVGRFSGDSELAIAAAGWVLAFAGLVLLADAQRRLAAAGLGELRRTSIGHALVSRAAALVPAGVALIAARIPAVRRGAMLAVVVLALAGIGVHVAAGHAAVVERLPLAAVGLQWLHFAAAGVWLGGLAVLLAGTRGEPDPAKTAAVHRYSSLAGIAIAIVAVTGILRTVQEFSSWAQLVSTDYGQAALAKAALLMAIAAFGALNRWHSVPAAPTTLRPLRRFALVELSLMIAALGVAAILATLAPPG